MLLDLSDDEMICTMVLADQAAKQLREATIEELGPDFCREAAAVEAARLEALAKRLGRVLRTTALN